MPSLRDVVQEMNENDKRFEGAIIVIRCKLVGVDDSLSANVADRPGYVWARRYNDTYGVFQVFNGNIVNPVVGIPVLVELSDGDHKYRIVGVDFSLSGSIDYDADTPVDIQVKHHTTHEWPDGSPGIDAVNVYLRSLVPLKAYPYSGYKVAICEGHYNYNGQVNTFYFGVSDLEDYIPASGYTRYVLLIINPVTSLIEVVLGDIIADTLTPTKPAVPIGKVPSAYVQLTGGMTEIREANFADARVILNAVTVNEQVLLAMFNDIDLEMTIHQIYGGSI